MLFDAHIAESHQSFELRPNSFTKIRQRDCFDVERVGARQLWFGFLMFAILFERDRPVFGDDELRAILKGLEFAGDAPETGFDFLLSFEYLAPDFSVIEPVALRAEASQKSGPVAFGARGLR